MSTSEARSPVQEPQVTIALPSSPTLPLMSTAQGMNLDQILLHHNVDKATRTLILYSTHAPKKLYLSSNEYYGFQRHSPQKFELLFFEDFLDEGTLLTFDSGNVRWSKTKVPYEYRKFQAQGVVSGSLLESLMRATQNEPLAQRFIEAFHTDLDMGKLERGAKFNFKYSLKYFQNKMIRFGEVDQAHFENAGRVYKKKFVGDLNQGTFVGIDSDEDQRPLYAPVDFVKITSLFSKRRFHPVRRNYQAHLGMDYELPEGWPVRAAANGRIIKIESHRASGNYIVIKHAGKLSTGYLHMLSMNPKLKLGSHVRVGEVIGQIGCTGYCTKAHLHYFVKKGEEAVDPARYTRSYPLQMTPTVIESRKKLRLDGQYFTHTETK